MRDPFGNVENSTRNARYRRFRRRRGAWPLLSALGLVSALVGAAVLLPPDRINPVEIASLEETASEDGSGEPESGGEQPEGMKSESKEGSSGGSEPAASGDSESSPEPQPAVREASEPETVQREDAEVEPEQESAPVSEEDSGEQAKERQKEDRESSPPPPANKDMGLTVPRLGIQDDSVTNSADPQVLHQGAQKLPSTGFPWQDGANTYIAGHRLGFPGTESHNQFYNLPAMQQGDPIYLTDANGETYEYRVTEVFAVSPSESWVTEPVAGRDMVTLQTCTHSPDDWWSITPQLFGAGPESGRLVVRADRV